jgi:SAM-dependent methyltransferase
MSKAPVYTNPEFDQYAESYDAALARGLAVSGESREYFAKQRVNWLTRCVNELKARAEKVLDFGCGTGASTALLLDLPGTKSVLGVEVSAESLKIASASHAQPNVSFAFAAEYIPKSEISLVFCNGVFHHIAPVDRAAAVRYIYDSLAPGGLFSFWENNPWNPGTRYVMSRIPFDKDAQTLSVIESRRLLMAGGFEILRSDFLFIFPRALKVFRPLERFVAKVPIGAQYQVLARKNGPTSALGSSG